MSRIDLLVPPLGVPDGRKIVVSCWLVRVGTEVYEGDRVVELLLGDTTFDVPAPADGRLVRIVASPDAIVRQGSVLGRIECEGSS